MLINAKNIPVSKISIIPNNINFLVPYLSEYRPEKSDERTTPAEVLNNINPAFIGLKPKKLCTKIGIRKKAAELPINPQNRTAVDKENVELEKIIRSIIGFLFFNSHLIKNAPSTFLIRVQGKSMNKIGICDGDLLVVDKSLNPKNFSTVIVNINEELVVKNFIKEDNQSFLTSGSKEIKDKINLTENPEILIWGVVTYVIHAL